MNEEVKAIAGLKEPMSREETAAFAHKLGTQHDLPFVTDKYFSRTRRTLEVAGRNPIVVYRGFLRAPALAVHKFAEEYLAATLGDKFDYRPLVAEGDFVDEKTPLLELEGYAQDLVEVETPLLWHIGWPSVSAYNASVAREVTDWKLLDMAARHCPGFEAQRMASYGAHLGGFDGCSTEAGSKTFGGDPIGTVPHFLIGAFPTSVEAHVAWTKVPEHKDLDLVALVDYYGLEQTETTELFKALGSRLWGIRLDTHGGRFCEGVTNTDEKGNEAAIHRLTDEFGVDFPGTYGDYAVGKGVTIEAVFAMRKHLDSIGAKDVKIVVSSGFTPEKTKAFVKAKAPVDAIGTGSFLPIDIRDTYATLDAVKYDGVTKVKVGREWLTK